MALSARAIIDDIIELSSGKRIWVAYSGGVDSHVLLHLLAHAKHPQLKIISAIHIDHDLHVDSEQWTQHCAEVCTDLEVDFHSLKVNVKNIESLGMEAAAREARYQAFQNTLTQNDILLTAQHQQDQAETLLLQLFRGAGPKGLSAMARNFNLGQTHVFRPLLDISQADILAYAKDHDLQWIDDPSNVETRWNRNYIRHKLWPDVIERWPSAAKTISRSAEHCAETSELLDALAKQDLAEMGCDITSDFLSISDLLLLTPARCRNLLRHFLIWKKLPLPSTITLQRLIDEVCLAKQDSKPLVSWSGVEIRRYQDQLHFMFPLSHHDNHFMMELTDLNDFSLEDGRVIEWIAVEQQGISEQRIRQGVTLRFRQGGERIKPQGEQHHKSLKHLFQQWLIPTWQRDRIPLIFCEDKLIAVVGYCSSDVDSANNGQPGYLPQLK